MKRIHIKCPYCGSQAFLRPASVVYGQTATAPAEKLLYVCARYPACDAYVAAHRYNRLPMGTLADKALRHKRVEAHTALDRLWKSGLMTKAEAYRWLQVQMNLPQSEAHIAKFSELRCEQVIQLCRRFCASSKHAA